MSVSTSASAPVCRPRTQPTGVGGWRTCASPAPGNAASEVAANVFNTSRRVTPLLMNPPRRLAALGRRALAKALDVIIHGGMRRVVDRSRSQRRRIPRVLIGISIAAHESTEDALIDVVGKFLHA